eukprot:scaffold66053_cov68-Phaeocystis_antarctica.AAC.2
MNASGSSLPTNSAAGYSRRACSSHSSTFSLVYALEPSRAPARSSPALLAGQLKPPCRACSRDSPLRRRERPRAVRADDELVHQPQPTERAQRLSNVRPPRRLRLGVHRQHTQGEHEDILTPLPLPWLVVGHLAALQRLARLVHSSPMPLRAAAAVLERLVAPVDRCADGGVGGEGHEATDVGPAPWSQQPGPTLEPGHVARGEPATVAVLHRHRDVPALPPPLRRTCTARSLRNGADTPLPRPSGRSSLAEATRHCSRAGTCWPRSASQHSNPPYVLVSGCAAPDNLPRRRRSLSQQYVSREGIRRKSRDVTSSSLD